MCSRIVGRTLGRRSSSLAAVLLLAMLAPGEAAPAAASLVNIMPPSVFGGAAVGDILVGFPGVWSGSPLELESQWRRCPAAGPCSDIPGASSSVYTVAPADGGHRIQLRVTARSGDATVVRDSEPTEQVPGAATAGEPSTTPVPVAAAAPAPPARRARLIEPFPEVRIRGRFTMRWTRFTLVTVRAPVGAAIAMTCSGRGCPFRDRGRTVTGRTLMRIRALERRFAPGVAIALRVTRPDRIGKATRIAIRRGRRPGRWDGCVMPGSTDPVACPPA
jgi:hypothetical protein